MRRFLIAAGALCSVAALAFALPYAGNKTLNFSLGVGADGGDAPSTQSASSEEESQLDAHGHESEEHHDGHIEISEAQIAAGDIKLAEAGPGVLGRTLIVPGTVTTDRNRTGKVPAKVSGTVAELRKRLGDIVEKGEAVAILDSREVADAKSEYINALVNAELQQTLFERQRTLYQKQISAEQNYLRAQALNTEAKVKLGVARQKLEALGVGNGIVEALSKNRQAATNLQRYEVTAPLSGRVVQQMVDLGTPVGGEDQPKELYAIADLSVVWIEIPIVTNHLRDIREDQKVTILDSRSSEIASGKVIFTSPMISEDTRTARVIASVGNSDFALRPGSFVNVCIYLGADQVALKIPKHSLQKLNGDTVVFVRNEHGFEPRKVVVGNSDETAVEIVSGLEKGENVAATNTFLLKAEHGKSEAKHSH
jgi:cobalt-zinc-cadmium efflux system membrane fusion protein